MDCPNFFDFTRHNISNFNWSLVTPNTQCPQQAPRLINPRKFISFIITHIRHINCIFYQHVFDKIASFCEKLFQSSYTFTESSHLP